MSTDVSHQQKPSPDVAQKTIAARAASDERGVAATEFALILPFGFLIFVGAVGFGIGDDINHKVTNTARTITDLVARCSQIETADMTTMLNATTQVMAPYYSSANTTLVVAEVEVTANNNTGTIQWFAPSTATGYTNGQVVQLPTGMTGVNTPPFYLVWGHVSYIYSPPVGASLLPAMPISDDFYIQPRAASQGQIYYPPQSGQNTTCQ
jgi:Flp pilus assembly protein TadG